MSHASQNPNMLVVFFPQFHSNHHPNTYHYAFLTKKWLRRQVRRKMNGSESKEILKGKSFNERTENIYHRARKIFKRWVVTETDFWLCVTFETDLE